VAGLLWGARLGVQFSLSLVGAQGPAGADRRHYLHRRRDRRQIIGASEKSPRSTSANSSAAASKTGFPMSRHCSCWCGLPGCSASAPNGIRCPEEMPACSIKKSVNRCLTRRPPPFRLRQDRVALWLLLGFAFFAVPWLGNDYWFSAILVPLLVLSLAGLGLNLLTGYAGQLSLGSAAFMAVGAFAPYNLNCASPDCRCW
jgi:hypothetical protein